jgi:tRNA/rRNA methyltransferase/tRNA (cytidine32/uridine32-2'-O)-methyltransferase
MKELLDNVVLVLYQPQDVINVGSVVRVMSNFGLRRLRLVEPAAYDPYRIVGIAHHTAPVIEAIERVSSLEESIADCGFVLGATARSRGVKRERLTPRNAANTLLQANRIDQQNVSAVLFGREDDGLPNEALDYCHALVTIPTDDFNASLNLAQATLVIAYELWLAANPQIESLHPVPAQALAQLHTEGIPPRWGEPASVMLALQNALSEDIRLANGTDREAIFAALSDLLLTLHPNSTDERLTYSMSRLRAVLLRAAPRRDESRMLAHLFQNINRKLLKLKGGD